MTVAAVAAAVGIARRSWPADWICLTGGEPFLQDIGPLVDRFHGDGFRVQVETNGTISRDVGDRLGDRLSQTAAVMKSPPEFLGQAREVKLVVSRELTLPVVRRVRANLPSRHPDFSSARIEPAGKPGPGASASCGGRSREGLAEIRLGIQLHRVFGLR